ncbi:MAG: hypothetical protein VX589_19930 [Myxococcota bacterium]|nr:hypothetical protein [Myxococcota bacterium]
MKYILLGLAALGCTVDNSEVEPADAHRHVADSILARAGQITIDKDTFAEVVTRARVMRQWLTNQPAPSHALNQSKLRKKLLIDGLENLLIREAVQASGIQIDPALSQNLLQKLVLGVAPNQPLPADASTVGAMSSTQQDHALETRYRVPAQYARDAVAAMARREALADVLIETFPDSDLMERWAEQNDCVAAVLYRISRVPTAKEIDRAVRERSLDIGDYYRRHPRLFGRPARVFTERMRLQFTPGDRVSRAEAQTQISALRAQAMKGANIAQMVREHGPRVDARNGGKFTVRADIRPDLFERPAGTITPIEAVADHFQFFKISGHAPRIHRPLHDPRVQRECAAGVLRETNELVSARAAAERLRLLLNRKASQERIDEWVAAHRIRIVETSRFCRSRFPRVPTIGLAPQLFKQLLALGGPAKTTEIVRVRQDFVIGHLILRERVNPDNWPVVKRRFRDRWRKTAKQTIVEQWIGTVLKDQTRWVDMEMVSAIPTPDLLLHAPAVPPTD